MNALKATVWIGKRGITDSQTNEIKAQLSKKSLIKIKVLKNALGKVTIKEIAAKIALDANAELVSVIGLVIVLRKSNG
ncbi:MAG: YhbY family RNA-binding protein [Nanoarchaeota archaeon]